MERQQHYSITSLDQADVEPAERMRADSWIDTYPNETLGVTEESIRQRVDKWLDEDRLDILRKTLEVTDETRLFRRIARDEAGKIIGTVVAHKDKQKQMIKALYVDKQHHGTGVAKQLLDASLEWFERSEPIYLEVASYNERAVAFYEKHGFIKIERSEHIFGDTIPSIDMIRKAEEA